MKKQILILILAIFAFGISTSYGQTCTPGMLNPAPGVPYDYTVTIGGPTFSGTGHYQWYVTQDVNLLLTAPIIPNDGSMFTATGTYNAPLPGPNQQPTINITWTAAAVASPNPYYLVIKFYGENTTPSPTCQAMNMKVWQIDPINSFLIEIVTVDEDGNELTNANICAPEVDGATVTPGATPTVQYSYSSTTMYYKITASGVIGAWKSRLYLSSPELLPATDRQIYTSIEWSYDVPSAATVWNSYTGINGGTLADGGEFASGEGTTTNPAISAPATPGDNPETPIYVRIVIDNNSYEHLGPQTLSCAINGSYGLSFETPSIIGSGATPCDPYAWVDTPNGPAAYALWTKTDEWIINARPTITEGATMDPFITKTP